MKELESTLLIDQGFRIPTTKHNVSEVLVAGKMVKRINAVINSSEYKDDIDYFKSLNKFIRNNQLKSYREIFAEKDHTTILEKYLCRRNAEQILSDGFFTGCRDLCIVNAAILKSNNYQCQLIDVVSEQFFCSEELICDLGHVFVYIKKDEKDYLFDPSMSKEVYPGYKPGIKQFEIKSDIGDLYIFAITDNPRKVGIMDKISLRNLRKIAYDRWY